MKRIETGRIIAGYRVKSFLGQGGMGAVYEAEQISLHRTVALKIMPEAFTRSRPEKIDRFLREARLAAQLNHPNIVQIIDAGREGELFFIAMEYVKGEDLHKLVSRHGPLPQDVCMALFLQAAQALAAAHDKKLVHRDIKPENIIVTPKGVVKVADFGLAKDVTSEVKLTRPGAIIGTPAYMSPEQARGKKVDHRGDLYSLGATLFFSATGKPPFRGRTPLETVRQVVARKPPALEVFVSGFDKAFTAILDRLMEKDPQARLQTPADLLAALESVSQSSEAKASPSFQTLEEASMTLGELTLDLPLHADQGESGDYFDRFEAKTMDEAQAGGASEAVEDRMLATFAAGDQTAKIFLFSRTPVLFGRREEANLEGRPTRVDLVLRALPCRSLELDPVNYRKNLTLSRLHGRFDLDEGKFTVTDRQDSLGIRLDGRQLPKEEPQILSNGMEISVGREAVRMTVDLPADAPFPAKSELPDGVPPGPGLSLPAAVLRRRDRGLSHVVYVLLRKALRLDSLLPGPLPAALWVLRGEQGLFLLHDGDEGDFIASSGPLPPRKAKPVTPGLEIKIRDGELRFSPVLPRDFKEI